MYNVIIAGVGQIGSLLANLLIHSGDYHVHIVDIDLSHFLYRHQHLHSTSLDLQDQEKTEEFFSQHPAQAIVSCLPYYLNVLLARLAKQFKLHYFDLTEDTATVQKLANWLRAVN